MKTLILMALTATLAAAEPSAEQIDQLVDAAWFGKMNPLRQLLNAGVGPNVKDWQGQTPLDLAAGSRQLEAVRVLLQHGADPNLRGRTSQSALAEACWDGETEIARLLLEAGAEPSPPDRISPVYAAVLSGNLKTLQLLMDWKAQPNPAPPDFDPATVWAAHNFPEGLDLLLRCGADPWLADPSGFTPLSRAVTSGNLESTRVLLGHKVNPDKTGKGGRLALEIAADRAARNRQGHNGLQLLDQVIAVSEARLRRLHGSRARQPEAPECERKLQQYRRAKSQIELILQG